MTVYGQAHAWKRVLDAMAEIRANMLGPSGRINPGRVNQVAADVEELAHAMLDALHDEAMATGGRKRYRPNPSLIVWGNPGGTMQVACDSVLSRRVYEIAYRHHDDGRDYKHGFKAGVVLYTVTTSDDVRGALLVGNKGQPLWNDF